MLYHITFTGVRRMKKSPYDRERFFEKYSQMDRSRLGLAGAGEWESLEPLLPDFAGKRVLDLGCGYGWHCIYAAEHGAAAVTGVDLSEKMLAVARALMSKPDLLMLDEPSLGLAPLIIRDIFNLIRQVNRETGTTVLLGGQNAKMALSISNRAYVLETGLISLEGSARELLDNEQVKQAYLGG